MREIKFRGRRIDNNKWVYGDLTRYSEEMSYITVDLIEGEIHQVRAPTVGQFTGLLDDNGKEIYEGDILNWGAHDYAPNSNVFYDDGAFKVTDPDSDSWELLIDVLIGAQIIGNIHENPELLKTEVPI